MTNKCKCSIGIWNMMRAAYTRIFYALNLNKSQSHYLNDITNMKYCNIFMLLEKYKTYLSVSLKSTKHYQLFFMKHGTPATKKYFHVFFSILIINIQMESKRIFEVAIVRKFKRHFLCKNQISQMLFFILVMCTYFDVLLLRMKMNKKRSYAACGALHFTHSRDKRVYWVYFTRGVEQWSKVTEMRVAAV